MSEELIDGHEYCATLQLRTPLAALLKDGERTPSRTPPENPFEMEHGAWFPTTRTWRDLGIDLDELSDGEVASDIGPVDRLSYRNFLISLKIVASDREATIADRIERIKSVLTMPEHRSFSRRHGGQASVIEKLFPRVLSAIPGLTRPAAEELWKARIRCISRIRQTSDERLLELPGIGKKKVDALRAFCAEYCGDPLAERIDPDH
ncbi:helix-hairpin-helix domain-containing protein [Aromatoleum evansii]|uniref:helix-hairpin-helix domain-containing protein n=1 Tax=Aromatoleum evansii TaxID=59406 RepID=UPI00145D93C0|nr:hypothetical protein [Aromatoleum evansii]NMG32368.1 hypothetical protein [Aromatoleum evansii]